MAKDLLGILFAFLAAITFLMDAVGLLFFDVEGDTGLGVFFIGAVMTFFALVLLGVIN